MSWITVIWSMVAGVSLTFAAVHFLVWLRDREALANLLFSVSAAAATIIAIQELSVMRAQTTGEFGAILRWMHVPVAILVVALVWLIRSYLGAGRLWLAWLITGLRGLVLIINFSLTPNATFQEIHALREVFFLGETLSAPVGDMNPWRYLIHLSTVLFLIYTVDAAIAARKVGRGRQALVLGTTVLFAIIVSAIFAGLMVRGILPGPLIALGYMTIILAMALELSMELIRARQLSLDLRESEERMCLAARAAELGFWDWDVRRDEVWIDDVGRERIGAIGPGLASHERYLSQIHPDDRNRVKQALELAIEDDKDFQTEFRMTGRNGDERWIAALGQVERNAGGEALRLRGISMDITARKRFEGELQKHRNALNHTQRVFAMGQLSAALAHELNQPLGAILRNAEAGELLLRQTPPDIAELREIFVDIQRDDQRAAQVIDRMRTLLRDRNLQYEVIALQELIEQVVALLSAEMQARGVAFRMTVPPKPFRVRGDRVHLQQVLVNLLLNSLDALGAVPEGARQIEMSVDQADGGLVELSVKDNGTGIDPDRLLDLFEPFVTTKTEGTGIGLAITKTIVERHGGHIHAQNNAEGGACIRITLPAVWPEEAA